jgi:hypothetical protein
MKNDGIDPNLKKIFDDLQDVPPRDQKAAELGRVSFLKQAAAIRQTRMEKHNSRRKANFSLFNGNRRLPVWNTIIAAVLAVFVFLGGSGATVYAAQDSLPDQSLYPIKTWSEDALISVTGSSQKRLTYVMAFSDRRLVELSGLLAEGRSVPDVVETRFQNELDLALELIAGMDDPQAIQELEQVQMRSESQYQTTMNLIPGAPASAGPLLTRTCARLQEQIRLATLGKTDLKGFRLQIQKRFRYRGHFEEQTPTSDNNSHSQETVTPTVTLGTSGNSIGNNPNYSSSAGYGGSNTTVQGGSTSGSSNSGGNQSTGSQDQYNLDSNNQEDSSQSGGNSQHGP